MLVGTRIKTKMPLCFIINNIRNVIIFRFYLSIFGSTVVFVFFRCTDKQETFYAKNPCVIHNNSFIRSIKFKFIHF